MSCVITYKGQNYSEEQFKEYFINNKQEFISSIAKNKNVIDSFKRKMEGIDINLYSQYLEQNPNGSVEGFKSWVDNRNNFDEELAQKNNKKFSYSQLGNKTQSENVIIDSVAGRNPSKNGEIIAYRTNSKEGKSENVFINGLKNHNSIGNPFSHTTYSVINSGSIKQAVEDFVNWVIGNDYTDFFQNYRQEIINKIPSLKDKKIIYYDDIKQPSHATALDWIINSPDSPFNQQVYNFETKAQQQILTRETEDKTILKINKTNYSVNHTTGIITALSDNGNKTITDESIISKVYSAFAEINGFGRVEYNGNTYSKVFNTIINMETGKVITDNNINNLFTSDIKTEVSKAIEVDSDVKTSSIILERKC